jgi:hypothetical protein
MVCLFSIANRWTDQLETEKARTVVASRHPQFLSKPPTALGRLYLTADLTLGRGGGRPQARATLGKCYMRDSLLRFNKQFSLWTFFFATAGVMAMLNTAAPRPAAVGPIAAMTREQGLVLTAATLSRSMPA